MAASANMRAFSPRSLGSMRMMMAAAIGDSVMIDKKGNSINSLPA
jgi:hypothetical protein